MSKFEEMGLNPKIVEGIHEAGFEEPFPIQEKAIDPMLRGMDVIGQARTGTGKTAAYGIPLLQLVDEGRRDVQGLVLAPTRELAVQIAQEIRKLGKYTRARVVAIYGGQAVGIQLDALSRGSQIVVGTPGRIIDLINREILKLNGMKFVVLDEADTMLDMGFIDDVETILDAAPNMKQMSLFSATMPERIVVLARKYMHHPERVYIDSDEPSVESLDQYFTVTEDKLATVSELLSREKPSSALVFCATKRRAHRLARDLDRQFQGAAAIHGNLTQHQRDRVMGMFRSGNLRVLVATDIAARGIDVPHIDCVINFDVPNNPLLYFHRVGRTARAMRSGRSYTLVSSREFGDFARIRELTKTNIKALRPEDEATNFQSYREQGPQRPFFRKRRPFHSWSNNASRSPHNRQHRRYGQYS